ncbi:FtsH protease activity modulator HflK [Phenylobacterium sp. J426]|uniref:FtsH protease activity modulator HflK n=1 Tax=Phenylobacterium sp. J426 TaxID=2898439 RepID=UPI002150826F|nr:FtsH protease activity modulator HflK [Phenylobacterium sp. J426]MCR5874859.1 FtsH protease activity modulator HflK [Phenylobacterium sp. J426]
MPWNDNANPGPWGSPPSGDGDRNNPPPRRPRNGGGGRGPNGPDFNAGFDQLGRRLRDFMGGPGGIRPGAIAAIAGAAVGLWALSGIYVVESNEEAVVTTFGAYSRNEGPGLRYHLPAPIERVQKVPVTSLQRLAIGGASPGALPEESLMVTGDENIIDLQFSVTWRISDADQFVFTIRDPEESVKAVAESAMREVVGRTPLLDIISKRRGQVELETAELMQRTLDAWGTGVRINEVQISAANAPQQVQAAFRDVISAQQDQESAVNEANGYRNRVVNEAQGDAARIIQSAEAYREQAVREATGDASRFNAVLNEYRRAPGATRDRIYIETMQRVLQRSNKVIVDSEGASAPIILPPDVFRPRTQPQGAPTPDVSVQPQGARSAQ